MDLGVHLHDKDRVWRSTCTYGVPVDMASGSSETLSFAPGELVSGIDVGAGTKQGTTQSG